MSKRVLIPLLAGFEEIEAVTLIDVLRRAGVQVLIGGDAIGPVTGAHGIAVDADVALARVEAGQLDAIVLPGGMPGAEHLAEHARVQGLIRALAAAGALTAAICAAPIALAAAGVHRGKRVTCYPGFEAKLEGAAEIVAEPVVVDGAVITSRGPGTAIELGVTLAGLLAGPAIATKLRADLIAPVV